MMPIINIPLTGLRIKELMEQRGFSVKDIQTQLGLAVPSGIYKWLAGETLPSIDHLVELAVVFDVKIDDILVVE